MGVVDANSDLQARIETAPETLTDGFHLLIDALKLNGIEKIYNVPGIPITDLGRYAQAAGIRVLSFRHEQHAGYAASLYQIYSRNWRYHMRTATLTFTWDAYHAPTPDALFGVDGKTQVTGLPALSWPAKADVAWSWLESNGFIPTMVAFGKRQPVAGYVRPATIHFEEVSL